VEFGLGEEYSAMVGFETYFEVDLRNLKAV
jgi:hypothetical protein